MANTGIYIFLLSLAGSFIQRVTGFGFGIFIMTMLPMLMPSYGEATTLSGLLAMSTSLVVAIRMRKLIVWKRLLPLIAVFLVFSFSAVAVLGRIDTPMLRKVLGAVLIAVAIYFAFFQNRIKIRPTPLSGGIAGALSGLMGGFFAMQGPPAVLYLVSSEPDKEHYMAMVQAYFLIGNLLLTFARAMNGFTTAAVGWGYLYGIGGVAIGATLGAFVFKKLTSKWLKYIIYAYIAVSGIVNIVAE